MYSILFVEIVCSQVVSGDINTIVKKYYRKCCFKQEEPNWNYTKKKIHFIILFQCSNLNVFSFSMFMLIVQEDAEPRAKPPIRNESLRQPSLRVHLQHFPRWALQHIHTDNSHTRMENTLYRRVSVGHPKLCRDPELCAPLLTNQSDLVWRREREFPLLGLQTVQEGGGSGRGMERWERCVRMCL